MCKKQQPEVIRLRAAVVELAGDGEPMPERLMFYYLFNSNG